MKVLLKIHVLFFAVSFLFANGAFADYGAIVKVAKEYSKVAAKHRSDEVAASGSVEVAFSPDEGAESLVIKLIASAKNEQKKELLVLAYSFTSAPITSALIDAVKSGVSVHVVVDNNHNLVVDKSSKARAALSALKNAGADVRTIDAYPIHHDKLIIAGRNHVQVGSFNYTTSAQERNSEYVQVNWNNPALAGVYLKHFQRNYQQASVFNSAY